MIQKWVPTCVCTREGAQNPGMLSRPVVNFYNVVQSGVEEGELAEDHWGGGQTVTSDPSNATKQPC